MAVFLIVKKENVNVLYSAVFKSHRVVAVASLAVQLDATDAHVGSSRAVSQRSVAHIAAKAAEVVEQVERLDYHRSTTA